MISLKPHQQIPVDYIKNNFGLILYHSTGSGKTLTSLLAVNQFNKSIYIIGSKSSRKSFDDDINKAGLNSNNFTFFTYTKIKQLVTDDIYFFEDKCVILDEAHNIRNENMHNIYLAAALSGAFRLILLTATPVVNYLNDLSVLVNIIKKKEALPTERKMFEMLYYDDENNQIVNRDNLVDILRNTISYYSASENENRSYPDSNTIYKCVEMDAQQIAEYTSYVKKFIYDANINITDEDILQIDYATLPNKKKNMFLNATRQLSNTAKKAKASPKILEILDIIKNGPRPVIVYSNFLDNGVYTLAIQLQNNNISYGSITGFTSSDKLSRNVEKYNKGDYQVLLITSAGSESLDLKNTRQIHIMEPHWNESRIDQVTGRAIRYMSHSSLPQSERVVDIYRWISVFPEYIKNISADEYLMKLSKDKKELWKQYHDIIIESSIEKQY
jgi:superfamily II DNA or RNA helicase